MLTSSADSNIGIWNPFNYTRIGAIYNAHSDWIMFIKSLGTDSGYFATAGSDNLVKIWETQTFRFVRRLTAHTNTINTLEILSNGYLASGSEDFTVKTWDTSTGEVISSYTIPTDVNVNDIRQLNNGILVIATGSRIMYFLNMTSSIFIKSLTLGTPLTVNLYGALSYNNDQIVVTAWNQTMTLINTSTYAIIQNYSTTYKMYCFEHYPISKISLYFILSRKYKREFFILSRT